MNEKVWQKKFYEYLESWPDSSLENLFLIFSGESHDILIKNLKDKKISELFGLMEHLEHARMFSQLESIRISIAHIVSSLE